MKSKILNSKSDRIFYGISGVILFLLLLSVAYPIIYIISASFSSGDAINSGKVVLFPVDFCLDGYNAVFGRSDIWLAYINTIYYTVTGTIISVSVSMMCAYPLARKGLRGKGILTVIMTFTMFFSGGMIPSYMLIKDLHMLDKAWSLILPGAMSVYNVIVARTFIQNTIPNELFEAANIDGCSDTKYFFRIVLPLSKAVIAVLALNCAVGFWNSYFSAMMYLDTRSKMPLQIILREILIMNQIDYSKVSDPELLIKLENISAILKYALIIVSTLPILCVYPFLQKYFVKGVMIGSIKG